MPAEKHQIVSIDSASLGQGAGFELQDSSEFKVISGFGAKIREIRLFKSLDDKFDVGLTKIDKVTLRFQDWPIDEFVSLLKGRVEITDRNKNAQVFEEGESFVIPQGFNGVWRQLSPVTMITIFYSKDAQNHHN